jgi:hypothetical protein
VTGFSPRRVRKKVPWCPRVHLASMFLFRRYCTPNCNYALELIPSPSNKMWLNAFPRDQLYFDRVHQSLPILHQKRYLSWSKSSYKSATRRCLQYAMWTIASLLSAHSSHMAEPLYRESKQMLESLTTNEPSSANTELAQAWVLVVTFESMRTYHHQAWLSAGRAFRLVQGMRYHSLDRPIDNHCPSALCGDLIEIEERRRVFWMAYFLDHVISMRDNWPITLNEHVVRD